MSVKHVKRYYNQICDQYQEMLNDLKDLEKDLSEGIVAPELLDRVKHQIEPIKINYERWAYMMFLLNQPERKAKVKRYERQNKKLLSSLNKNNSLEAVISENEDAIKHIGV